jgi:hypothetical protein
MEKQRLGNHTYHHVFDAVVVALVSAVYWLIDFRLSPIANEVLAACPEYRYATKGGVSEENDTKVRLNIP